jgi:hypothetical protein
VQDLVHLLVQNRLCGEVATPVGSCVGNCRRLVEGDDGYTFGLSDWREATFDDAVAALEAAGGGRLRDHPDNAPAYIDPAGTLAGVRRHRAALAGLVAGGGGRVLLATGHPILLPHYGAVGRALVRAGCRLLRPIDDGRLFTFTPEGRPCSITYAGGVAALFHDGVVQHTHHSHYMEAMLVAVPSGPPDLVVADHGFAGAAIEAGIPTISIADVNDPALPLAQAKGRTDGVLLIDDGLPPYLFAPVTQAILSWSATEGPDT